MKKFKLRSGNTTPFKQMGASPVKQTPKNFNIKGGPAKPDFSKWAKSIDPRAKNILTKKEIAKKLANRVKTAVKQEGMKAKTKMLKQVGKKVGKKVIKGIGGKTLGVVGMMIAKSASADQPGTGKHGGTKVPKLKNINKK
tara:strand:+ start:288 stop:707 length:420 start_codon:yes stop_codon:yes gene_type:complete